MAHLDNRLQSRFFDAVFESTKTYFHNVQEGDRERIEKIDLQDLPPYLQGKGDMWSAQSAARLPEQNALEEQERLLLVRALEEAGGNQSQAARKLNIGRDALRYKIKKYGLENIS